MKPFLEMFEFTNGVTNWDVLKSKRVSSPLEGDPQNSDEEMTDKIENKDKKSKE